MEKDSAETTKRRCNNIRVRKNCNQKQNKDRELE